MRREIKREEQDGFVLPAISVNPPFGPVWGPRLVLEARLHKESLHVVYSFGGTFVCVWSTSLHITEGGA